MQYQGKLFGNVGGRKYFDLGSTSEDWDTLEKSNKKYAAAAAELLKIIEGKISIWKNYFNNLEPISTAASSEVELLQNMKSIILNGVEKNET